MSVGRHLSLMFIALIFIITIIPQAQAAANCQLKPSCSIGEVHVANVANAATGGHAAPNTSGIFSDQMCCEANFTDPGLGLQPAFSISTVDGNQGHVSEAGEFDFDVQSSYDGCQLVNRGENVLFDEVCIAGVTNSGTLPSGETQGHLTTCGTTSHNIICCPFGYVRTGLAECSESAQELDIIEIHGYTTVDVNTHYVYDLEIHWEGTRGIEGEFYATPRGSSIREGGDFTFTHPSYRDEVNFTETFNFPSVGNYTIHAEGLCNLNSVFLFSTPERG